jgi:hypothetical protein
VKSIAGVRYLCCRVVNLVYARGGGAGEVDIALKVEDTLLPGEICSGSLGVFMVVLSFVAALRTIAVNTRLEIRHRPAFMNASNYIGISKNATDLNGTTS